MQKFVVIENGPITPYCQVFIGNGLHRTKVSAIERQTVTQEKHLTEQKTVAVASLFSHGVSIDIGGKKNTKESRRQGRKMRHLGIPLHFNENK